MPKLSNRERFLLGLLAIGSVALWLALAEDPQGLGNADLETDFDALQLKAPPVVHLELLELETADFDAPGRNLFAYFEPRKIPPPQPSHTPTTIDKTSRSTDRIPLPPTPPAPTAPPQPAFKYIGLLGPKSDRIAVFDRGSEVFVAQAGEILDDRFELLEFRHDAVVLGRLDEDHKGETVRLRKRPG